MWFNNVLPALLPFMIATNMLVLSGFAQIFAKLFSPVMQKLFRLPGAAGFAFFAGITSGYPVGAKTVADLRRTEQISARDAQHLLAFCNNAGPIFILGVVGAGMFQSVHVGHILLAAHVISAIFVGILLRGPKTDGATSASGTRRLGLATNEKPPSFGAILSE
ncbi:MAG: sporulation integral membrane protein YlbJ, partial [Defluviitaleaceae bacterium]|nr:sporulation integral membrane protein YlbJ [Defluviitaleaceae bacterium]